MIFARLIKAYVEQNNETYRSLAKKIGVKHITLYRFARGYKVRSDLILKIITWCFSHAK